MKTTSGELSGSETDGILSFRAIPYAGAPRLAGGDPDEMAALAATVRSTWGSFVRTGDPQYKGSVDGFVLQ